jgi:YD repeat-containing protein
VPNGVQTSASYDAANRLSTITHTFGGTNLEAISYQVDGVGKRIQMTDRAGTATWDYDGLDRLTSVSYPNGDSSSYPENPV